MALTSDTCHVAYTKRKSRARANAGGADRARRRHHKSRRWHNCRGCFQDPPADGDGWRGGPGHGMECAAVRTFCETVATASFSQSIGPASLSPLIMGLPSFHSPSNRFPAGAISERCHSRRGHIRRVAARTVRVSLDAAAVHLTVLPLAHIPAERTCRGSLSKWRSPKAAEWCGATHLLCVRQVYVPKP